MTRGDVAGVIAVVHAADDDADRRAGRQPQPRTDEAVERRHKVTGRFIERDPEGAWVAVEETTVVGMAEAIRRGSFWGLSMLFVDPAWQSQGVGRQLLEAALGYAEGAEVRMILTSSDPRALRRYSRAGLAIHPAVDVEGRPDRTALPLGLPGRPGGEADLGLVAEVDAGLRGSRAEDVAFLVALGSRIDVIDNGGGRGYVVYSPNRLIMLGATDETTAALLLWRFLAESDGTSNCGGSPQDRTGR